MFLFLFFPKCYLSISRGPAGRLIHVQGKMSQSPRTVRLAQSKETAPSTYQTSYAFHQCPRTLCTADLAQHGMLTHPTRVLGAPTDVLRATAQGYLTDLQLTSPETSCAS